MLASLTFTQNGEGHVNLQKEFLGAHWVTQADALQDWIVDLTDYYNQLLLTHEPIRSKKTP